MRLASFFSFLFLLVTTPALAELDSFGLGDGHLGALTVSTPRRTINAAVPFSTEALSGGTLLVVDSTESFSKGDLVLVHQTAGFDPGTASGSTGNTDPGNVGRWEFGRVARVVTGSPTEIHLTAPLAYSYTAEGAQVVRVPEYSTVTITSSGTLVAPAWNGRSGGIVAFLATGAVTHNGVISADGLGFRGGAFANHASTTGCAGNDVLSGDGGAYKGEGVVVKRYGTAAGAGNLVNAGGGGNCNGAGGGGGGHRGLGGTGGRSAPFDSSRTVGGKGGVVMAYSIINAALFGGGGGAGEGDDNAGSAGAAGGGMVLVRAASMSGTGRVSANGASASAASGEDASGGGGAGGSVIVRVGGALQCGAMQANGGHGGDVVVESSAYGPGGGGGGGFLLAQGSSISCPTSIAPGDPGSVTNADAGTFGPSYGASAGGSGEDRGHLVPFKQPSQPVITSPTANQVGVRARPVIQGSADPGHRIILYVDGAASVQFSADTDGAFSVTLPAPALTDGVHTVSARSEGLGLYSIAATEVSFTVGAAQASDAGTLAQPVIVVPEAGDVTGPLPFIAGVAPDADTVGIYLDDRPEAIVKADAFGRFRFQVPDDEPLLPGPHRVNAHAHSAAGDTGPSTANTIFESVEDPQTPDAGEPDSGTPDAGAPDSGTPDSGTPDSGTSDGGTQPTTDAPVVVVPASGEVVDPRPLFAGAALPGASVALEVDGTRVATVVVDSLGAFRYVLPKGAELVEGEHAVSAYLLVTNEPGPRSPSTSFQVRGPTALDVGCGGCGASPAGMAGAWALLVGWAALVRRRRR
ncbi:hypothetical protein LZ198_05670 [Myxococcus sp. K15C18031901]|uniref:adventurous gliding motility protein AgmC n=1 Tax=Myxococcus dinghuensis TaxID=2906761 RepID=UPI0020A7B547|nr:MYXO-CTERM sorting domain-containing protein [Myxococcus dinghuensis]MCP3098367.1 hypothetical protein [Myxococcus dinghuensis]